MMYVSSLSCFIFRFWHLSTLSAQASGCKWLPSSALPWCTGCSAMEHSRSGEPQENEASPSSCPLRAPRPQPCNAVQCIPNDIEMRLQILQWDREEPGHKNFGGMRNSFPWSSVLGGRYCTVQCTSLVPLRHHHACHCVSYAFTPRQAQEEAWALLPPPPPASAELDMLHCQLCSAIYTVRR